MKYKLNNPTGSLAPQSMATFPEEPINVQLRRMRQDGVTPMSLGASAYDESINAPYDFQSDIRGDKMADFEFNRAKAKQDFIDRRTAQYEARRPKEPITPVVQTGDDHQS